MMMNGGDGTMSHLGLLVSPPMVWVNQGLLRPPEEDHWLSEGSPVSDGVG